MKISVPIWSGGEKTKISLFKNGTIDRNAEKAFQRGQCHALALALNQLTGWQIYGVVDHNNKPLDPGHVVVRNPKNGGYVDIGGYGAISRWRRKWGTVTLHPLTPSQANNLESYLRPHTKKAIPFAKKVLAKIGVKV